MAAHVQNAHDGLRYRHGLENLHEKVLHPQISIQIQCIPESILPSSNRHTFSTVLTCSTQNLILVNDLPSILYSIHVEMQSSIIAIAAIAATVLAVPQGDWSEVKQDKSKCGTGDQSAVTPWIQSPSRVSCSTMLAGDIKKSLCGCQ